MPDAGGGERRAFLRRSLADAASLALDAAARPTTAERRTAEVLGRIDHVVVLSFAGRSRDQVLGALDDTDGPVFTGGTDAVMTAPGPDDPPGARFAPEMLPVHALLATAFARADHWRADGRDPLPAALRAARETGTGWALAVDERQGVSTTLLADPEWPHRDPGAAGSRGGRLLPVDALAAEAAAGTLPPLVLVEPRSLVDPADFADAAAAGTDRSADARLAEQLLHVVFDAVRDGERAGRRMLLLVTARGSAERPGTVPALVLASAVPSGARIGVPLGPETPAQLVRARAGGRRALVDPQVRELAALLGGPDRALARWPRTAPAFAPPAPVGRRLRDAARRAHVDPEPEAGLLARVRAAVPGASLHSEQAQAAQERRRR